jgi:hypothetical protein
MRIGSEHSCSNVTGNRRSVASSRGDTGFADALASATEATDPADDAAASDRPPELSSATYRLFAAVATERGDDAGAAYFSSRAADAREAGIPLHPSGVLSDTGRWDYNEAAAAIPETGHFDTTNGQGASVFTPYHTPHTDAPAGCDGENTVTAATAADVAGTTHPDRLHPGFARRGVDTDESVQALLATLAS